MENTVFVHRKTIFLRITGTIIFLFCFFCFPFQALAASFDLIVLGGEPEGISAAIAAAESGLNVLLLEDDREPGGFATEKHYP